MSYAVVRKSLSLFEEDSVVGTSVADRSVKKKNTKDAMKLISSKKKGVWKELKSLKSQMKHKNKDKKAEFKSAIDKYKQNAVQDRTEDNIFYLQRLSQSGKLQPGVSDKVLKHNKGKLSKNNPVKEDEKQQSIFTDRDFDRIEDELDNFFS